MSNLEKKVDFHLIRYANCWEDPDILLQGLSPRRGGRILSIGSAGDNSFLLLTCAPESVVAVDVSPVQLHLVALKKAAIARLDYEDLLAFLGFRPSSRRLVLWNGLKNDLTADVRGYWTKNADQIERGLIHEGKFERYLRFFATRILPLIHAPDTTRALLAEKSTAEQVEFYQKHWNTTRWQWLFKIFFSRYVMGKYGRDPAFLQQVEMPVSQYIYQKAGAHLMSPSAQQNFLLHYCLSGHFGPYLPPYLSPLYYNLVKDNLDCLQLHCGFAQSAGERYGAFDAMNLSNIFEYMDHSTFSTTAHELVKALVPGGRMAYWNLMVPRRVAATLPDQVQALDDLSEKLGGQDRGFFYSRFQIDEKQ